jgi:two-component system, cell cycle sensor histidine kinase and response regulator CckA
MLSSYSEELMVETETRSDNILTKEWIKDRLAIEEAVAQISKIILSPDSADFTKILSILGKASSVNRTYVIRFLHDNNEQIVYSYEWCDDTCATSMKDRAGDLCRLFYPSLIKRFESNENIMIPDVEALSSEFATEKGVLKSRDVHSLLVIPGFTSSGSLAGCIGFENTKEPREWLGEEVQNLRVVSGMISIYWERIEIFNALKKSREKYKELYEEVKKTEAVYRSLINSSADAIVMSDMDGEITYLNPSFHNMFGWSIDEMREKTVGFMPRSERYLYENLVREVVEKGNPCKNLECRRCTKDGKYMDVSLSVSRFDDHEGKPAGMLFIFRDITERKQLEAQLIQAQKMEAVGTLAGGIAHDFNNNLQGIFACTEILLMGKDEDHPDYAKLQTIEKSVERASNLTKQLLVFGRKMDNRFEPVDLNNEIKQISNILERTIPKMISIKLNLDSGISMINADPGQLEQIMINLGVNARDAMPDGGMLSFKTEEVILDEEYCAANPCFKAGAYVLLSVSDTGCGMKEEVLKHIFEPFFTTKKKGKGTGLGLSMVYGIVRDHGGNITCASIPGKGTIFKIFFPITQSMNKTKIAVESLALVKGNNETILFVDDEETNRELGKEILEGFGYNTITAKDGESALAYYRENKDRINLVIMDLIMPGMGGAVCLKEIIKFNPDAKVIIASGFASDKSKLDGFRYAAKDFINKPYNIKMMLNVIQRVLSRE